MFNRISLLVLFFGFKGFAYELYDPKLEKYFAVKLCSPVSEQAQKITYVECNDRDNKIKPYENGVCTNLQDSCSDPDPTPAMSMGGQLFNTNSAAAYSQPSKHDSSQIKAEKASKRGNDKK